MKGLKVKDFLKVNNIQMTILCWRESRNKHTGRESRGCQVKWDLKTVTMVEETGIIYPTQEVQEKAYVIVGKADRVDSNGKRCLWLYNLIITVGIPILWIPVIYTYVWKVCVCT